MFSPRFGLDHLKECLINKDGSEACPDPTWGAQTDDDNMGAYKSLDFLNAYHHFGAHPAENEPVNKCLIRTALAVILTMSLSQLTDFFGKSSIWGQDHGFVARLLVHLLRVVPANSHNIGVLKLAKSVKNYIPYSSELMSNNINCFLGHN